MNIDWMKWKKKYLSLPLAYFAKGLLHLLLRTCRIEVKGAEHLRSAAERGSCILMLWHNRLLMVANVLYHYAGDFKYRAIISNSRDGEPLAIFAESFAAAKVLRVAHQARREALHQMVACLQNKEIVIITPDGPRGPRYTMKPGTAFAAAEAGACVVPFSWSADRFWQLKTWDGMMIPKPFSRIQAVFGPAVEVPAEVEMPQRLEMLSQVMKQAEESACLAVTDDRAKWPK